MKFDLYKWQEAEPNEKYEAPKGRLFVRCSKDAALYVEAQGVEVLAGVGKEICITTQETLTFWVDAPKGARVFFENPASISYEPTGEVFSNADRQPNESGSVLEVTRALRQMKLEQRAVMSELREASRAAKRLRKMAQPEPEPEPEPEPVPEPEPDAPKAAE